MTRQLRDRTRPGIDHRRAQRNAQRRRRFHLAERNDRLDEPGLVEDGCSYINLCTALQPRAPVFWDMGGWQPRLERLGRRVSSWIRTQPDELRRLKASRYWVEQGREIYLRGIENNPDLLEALDGLQACSTTATS